MIKDLLNILVSGIKIHNYNYYCFIDFTIREGASHSLCRDGNRFFSVLGGFDTPETHIRHVQNLILTAEMESAS